MRDYAIDHEDLWPRDEEHRYRIYAVRGDVQEMEVIAATSTPGGVGLALVTLHKELKLVGSRLSDLGQIGVLDVIERDWIILPFPRKWS